MKFKLGLEIFVDKRKQLRTLSLSKHNVFDFQTRNNFKRKLCDKIDDVISRRYSPSFIDTKSSNLIQCEEVET